MCVCVHVVGDGRDSYMLYDMYMYIYVHVHSPYSRRDQGGRYRLQYKVDQIALILLSHGPVCL